jgi:hypothetical protein
VERRPHRPSRVRARGGALGGPMRARWFLVIELPPGRSARWSGHSREPPRGSGRVAAGRRHRTCSAPCFRTCGRSPSIPWATRSSIVARRRGDRRAGRSLRGAVAAGPRTAAAGRRSAPLGLYLDRRDGFVVVVATIPGSAADWPGS